MIEILLSTYNSELFLKQQLESIFEQTYKEWKLIIRDDGSSDNTIEILKFHIKKFPNKLFLMEMNSINIGVVKSFEQLLLETKSEYIMFCDHDDVWLPTKIEDTLNLMLESEKSYKKLPLLIHTDLKVVDVNLNEISNSFWKYSKLNQKLLQNFNYLGICNSVTGCTTMINRIAVEMVLPFPDNVIMHDSWIALVVAKYGKICYLQKPTILYRQHELNKIGAIEIKTFKSYTNIKFKSFSTVVSKNIRQYKLLRNLQYGCFLKYIYYKTSYFIKSRI